MKPILFAVFGTLGLATLTGLARAETNHAKAALYARNQGSDVQLAVEIQIEKSWHLYHGPTEKDLGGIKPGKTPVGYERLVDRSIWKDASALSK